MVSELIKIGPKGQVIIKKQLREKAGLRVGGYGEVKSTAHGLLISPISVQDELQEVATIQARLKKHWPSGWDCVDAIREGRR